MGGAVLARPETGALVALGEDEWISVELGALTIEIGCEARFAPKIGPRPLELAPPRPPSETTQVTQCMGSACDRSLEKSQIRMASTRVEGGLDSKLALRFANSLRGEWAARLRGEQARTFEIHYSALGDGRVGRARLSATRLSSKSKRCITSALETHGARPGPTENGRPAKVVQRVEVER